jgi:nucleotide-binding universal stress UspA family protein
VVSRTGARCITDGGAAGGWDGQAMTHPIVVAVADEDEAHDAIALGVMASRLLGAPLVLAGVVVTGAPGGATVVPGWKAAADPSLLREYTARRLHRLADDVPDDVPCTIRIAIATKVLSGLETAVMEDEAQLLVIGASHLGPLARAARGDIGAGAIRRAGCAVLVAPEGSDLVLDRAPRRIVVGWDGSPAAEGALDLAAHLAARAGADLEVLHATRDERPAAGEQLLLDEAVERASAGARTHGVVQHGPPSGILVAAGDRCELLVLGAHHTTGVASIWTRTVGTAVLHHARCPVLVVPDGAGGAVIRRAAAAASRAGAG